MPAATAPVIYTVRPGDTLDGIAAAHRLSESGLCVANRLADCNLIYPGQVLTLAATPGANPTDGRTVPAPTVPNRRPLAPTSSGITPVAYCQAALAYLAGHAAPGTSFTCAPGATRTVGNAVCAAHYGCTIVYESCPVPAAGQSPPACSFSGHVYLDSTLATYCDRSTMAQLRVAPEDEASNSYQLERKEEGLSYTIDAYGSVECVR